jgi:hypothetical protein
MYVCNVCIKCITLTFRPLSHNARVAFPFLLGSLKLSFAYVFFYVRQNRFVENAWVICLFLTGEERGSQIAFIMGILL